MPNEGIHEFFGIDLNQMQQKPTSGQATAGLVVTKVGAAVVLQSHQVSPFGTHALFGTGILYQPRQPNADGFGSSSVGIRCIDLTTV